MKEDKKLPAWAVVIGTLGLIGTISGFILMMLASFKVAGLAVLWSGVGLLFAGATAVCIGFYKPITKWEYKRRLKWGKELYPDLIQETLEETGFKDKTKVCPHCGEKIEESSKFCNHCGKKQ